MSNEDKSEKSEKRSGLWTSAVLTALIGLIGGAISGFATAYVQLSTAKDKYSIERAREFQNLMEKLESEKTSRLAVLNLWQLYPEERDRKIIIAAAFAVGQPDLVEIISGIDEELAPVTDVLQARSHSNDTKESNAALRTLMRMDPVRGARVIIERLNEGISLSGDVIRHPTTDSIDPIFELTDLAKQNQTVVEMIETNTARNGQLPVLFDYVLYRAKRKSNFIPRIKKAYVERSNLATFNDYLIRANFFQDDAQEVVAKVAEFILDKLGGSEDYRFEVQDALVGLRNSDMNDVLKTTLDDSFTARLSDTVSDSNIDDLTRARAFKLLRKVSPSHAIRVVASTLAYEERPRELTKTIEKQLEGLLLQLERTDSGFHRPRHCVDEATDSCVANHAAWAAWRPNST